MADTGKAHVVVLDDYQGVARGLGPWDDLRDSVALTVVTEHLGTDEEVIERLSDARVVVAMRERTPLTRARLSQLPQLGLIVTRGMRNAAIDMEAAAELGITTCGTDTHSTATAELVWGLVLALTRNICREEQAMRSGGWQHTVGIELAGRTLGVVGLGTLGQRVALIGQAFGMEVIAWSQNLDAARAERLGIEAVSKQRLFQESDVVTLHLRLSERTRHVVSADEFAWMKPGAYLVNTSRGPLVDEEALISTLRQGRIAGAALDVYDTEPLPRVHPIRALPNTVLTPHIGFVTEESYRAHFHQAVEDIGAWLDGTPIRVLQAPRGTA